MWVATRPRWQKRLRPRNYFPRGSDSDWLEERGRPSNRKLPAALREHALALVESRYADFGPTLAEEKLHEQHGVVVLVETLRRWMIEVEIWVPRFQRARRVHQSRHRRSCFAE